MAFGRKDIDPRPVTAPIAPLHVLEPRTTPLPFGTQAPQRPQGAFGSSQKPTSGPNAHASTGHGNGAGKTPTAPSAVVYSGDMVVSANYPHWKREIMDEILATADVARLNALEKPQAAAEIKEAAKQIIADREIPLSRSEHDKMLSDLIDDILGFGPLQPLLDRDDIADIMINAPDKVFIEVGGKIERVSNCRFNDEAHVFNIAQKLVGQRGRRVDESNPMCDSRLNDGSRINVIVPPLVPHTTITIRKFRRDRLRLDDLVRFGAISQKGAELLKIISRIRLNVIVSGGTGSGKTTLLNCLTAYIDDGERIITCEDTAELQLQQPHVVTEETRPASIEDKGEVTMQMLVKNALRQRPNRIIIGEVRGSEMFDLLQAMNTGHEGSMGTLHANDPRQALSRMESMVVQGMPNLPSKTIRERIAESVHVIVHVNRLNDGTRRITHITELAGMEGDVISTQDLLLFKQEGRDDRGRVIGHHEFTGVTKPKFFEKAVEYGEGDRLLRLLSNG